MNPGTVPWDESKAMYDEHADVPLAERPHVDYTDDYNRTYGFNAYAVHAAGSEMLVVWAPGKSQGRRPKTEVEISSYTLSRTARPDTDDFACVKYGPDSDVWTGKTARDLIAALDRGESAFKHVSLF